MEIKFTNIAPVFIASDVKATVKYYTDTLGFKYAEHFDKIDNFATLYRGEVEIIVAQKKKGAVESNIARYGAGYDAYINTSSLDEIEAIYQEYKAKNVKVLTEPHLTDYGSMEFTFEDLDGRIIGIGLIADEKTFFRRSNYA